MEQLILNPIGTIHVAQGQHTIRLEEDYRAALQGLEGFGHLQVLWWFSQFNTAEARAVRTVQKPYKTAPQQVGIFATRSPVRPNPIGLTVAGVLGISRAEGIIHLDWLDAFDGTPVLDIKPYTPSSDRVEAPQTPAWCAHWPQSLEASDGFDWEAEFNF